MECTLAPPATQEVAQMGMPKLRAGMRYGTNLVAMAARQRGPLEAGVVGGRFVIGEVAKLPRAAHLALMTKVRPGRVGTYPTMYSDAIVDALAGLGVQMRAYRVD